MASNVYNNATSNGGKKPIYEFTKLTTIIKELHLEYDQYKYTVYRCAAKFVALQKKFFTSNMPYKLVVAVLERHGINDGDNNLMIPPFQLTSLIHDVFYAAENLGNFTKTPDYTLESATAVLSNFFWNIFDPHRRHSISLLEIKITFLLLCKLYVSDEMIAEFYHLLLNKKTRCVDKLNLQNFLHILSKIFSYLGEVAAYGEQNIPEIMDQCYDRCYDNSGLNEYQFHCLWTTTKTRFLIYANLLMLIKRIEDTEKLIHLNVCASCHTDKITGIRFKCRKCKNLSLCLKCFASGYNSHKHQYGHKMYEVFAEDLPARKLTHYLAKLCTTFCGNAEKLNAEESKSFCNTNDTVINDTELVTMNTNISSDANSKSHQSSKHLSQNSNAQKIDSSLSCLKTTTANALNVSGKLQIIIDKLLHQNEKLELQLRCVQTSSQHELTKFLSEHQQFLMDIINEMRNFSQHHSLAMTSYPTSSTPNRSNSSSGNQTLHNFSAVLNAQHPYHVFINQPHLLAPPTNKDSLTHSLNGADINRSYLDANKSDYSINDVSLWLNQKRSTPPSKLPPSQTLAVLTEVGSQDELNYQGHGDRSTRETEMANFKLLLNKVKEIVEDSYSDNTELSEATQNLENVLDSIIQTEEVRRRSLN